MRQIRKRLPTCGGRNLWQHVQRFLSLFGCHGIGRDCFFGLIRNASLKVRYPKRFTVKTTYSDHHYAVEPNRYLQSEVTVPKQVFVCDITYIPLGHGIHSYLFLITDAYSRMIVGHYLSDSLKHEGAEVALRRAKKLHRGNLSGVIHHSDRGSQYCCHDFLDCLREFQMKGSMTDNNHCAQNAIAERVNGMLKKEYGCDLGFASLADARRGVDQAIELYNYYAIHGSLKGKTPAEVHFGQDQTIQLWATQILPHLPKTPDSMNICVNSI